MRLLKREFRDASWERSTQVHAFARSAQGLTTDELLSFVPMLDGPEESEADRQRRVRVFAAITRDSAASAFFEPVLRAALSLPPGDAAQLVPLLGRSLRHHHTAILRSLFRSREPGDRGIAGAILAAAGANGHPILRTLLADKKLRSRRELVDAAFRLGGPGLIDSIAPLVAEGSSRERMHVVRRLTDPSVRIEDVTRARELLEPALDDDNDEVVLAALIGYRRIASSDDFFEMVASLVDRTDRPRLQAIAARALGSVPPTPKLVELLDRLRRRGDPETSTLALDALLRAGGEAVVGPLTRAVTGPDEAVRAKVWDGLTELINTGRVPVDSVILHVMAALEHDGPMWVMRLLEDSGVDPAAVWEPLIERLPETDWWTRRRVFKALPTLLEDDAVPSLVFMLEASSPVLRRQAADALGNLRRREAVRPLLDRVLNDPDWWVRERAVEALGAIGDPRVVPYLAKALRGNPALVRSVVRAVGMLRSREGLRVLRTALVHDDPDIRVAAISALTNIEDADVVGDIEPMMDDPDIRVRTAAEDFIVQFDGRVVRDDSTMAERLGGLDRLLWRMRQAGGDDLFLAANRPVYIKRLGEIELLDDRVRTPEEVEADLRALLTPAQLQLLDARRDVDCSVEVKSQRLRFRVNILRQQGGLGAVFRRIEDDVRSFEELGLPDLVRRLCDLPHGLVIIGGSTGSGKSTTLAAMVDYMNHQHRKHIITIEDPIEVVHDNARSLVTQREIGTHTQSFQHALRATLREDPDVILVGEMRDLETISFAVTAAETGHLVLGTLHTVSAETSVDRLIDAFPARQQNQIRAMLSQTLQAVICQQLLRAKSGQGRVPAFEVLVNTEAVANLIRKGQCFQLHSVIQTGGRQGMRLMDDELKRLMDEGLVEAEEAYLKAQNKAEFARYLRDPDYTGGFELASD